jgi:hypothetical protein
MMNVLLLKLFVKTFSGKRNVVYFDLDIGLVVHTYYGWIWNVPKGSYFDGLISNWSCYQEVFRSWGLNLINKLTNRWVHSYQLGPNWRKQVTRGIALKGIQVSLSAASWQPWCEELCSVTCFLTWRCDKWRWTENFKTLSQNKPFLLSIVYLRYFVTAMESD